VRFYAMCEAAFDLKRRTVDRLLRAVTLVSESPWMLPRREGGA